jgi:hypothetical protein
MTRTPRITWEAMGATAGIWAVLLLTISYVIASTTAADPFRMDYVSALPAERMKWEMITLVRLIGGALVLWFAGTLTGRLRVIEGEPGRLAVAALGPAVVWAALWLLSALFNSTSIELATTYDDPAGARLAGELARETPLVLTASVMFTLLLATSLVGWRFGGFPSRYTYGTTVLAAAFLLLALLDWYTSWNFSGVIITLAFAWVGVTSILLAREFDGTATPRSAS